MTDRQWEENLMKVVTDLRAWEQASRPPEFKTSASFQAGFRGIITLRSTEMAQQLAQAIHDFVKTSVSIFYYVTDPQAKTFFITNMRRMMELLVTFPEICEHDSDRTLALQQCRSMRDSEDAIRAILQRTVDGQKLATEDAKVLAAHMRNMLIQLMLISRTMESFHTKMMVLAVQRAQQIIAVVRQTMYNTQWVEKERLFNLHLDALVEMTNTRMAAIKGLQEGLMYYDRLNTAVQLIAQHRAPLLDATRAVISFATPETERNQQRNADILMRAVELIGEVISKIHVNATANYDFNFVIQENLDSLRDALAKGKASDARGFAARVAEEVARVHHAAQVQDLGNDPAARTALEASLARLKSSTADLLRATNLAIAQPGDASQLTLQRAVDSVRDVSSQVATRNLDVVVASMSNDPAAVAAQHLTKMFPSDNQPTSPKSASVYGMAPLNVASAAAQTPATNSAMRSPVVSPRSAAGKSVRFGNEPEKPLSPRKKPVDEALERRLQEAEAKLLASQRRLSLAEEKLSKRDQIELQQIRGSPLSTPSADPTIAMIEAERRGRQQLEEQRQKEAVDSFRRQQSLEAEKMALEAEMRAFEAVRRAEARSAESTRHHDLQRQEAARAEAARAAQAEAARRREIEEQRARDADAATKILEETDAEAQQLQAELLAGVRKDKAASTRVAAVSPRPPELDKQKLLENARREREKAEAALLDAQRVKQVAKSPRATVQLQSHSSPTPAAPPLSSSTSPRMRVAASSPAQSPVTVVRTIDPAEAARQLDELLAQEVSPRTPTKPPPAPAATAVAPVPAAIVTPPAAARSPSPAPQAAVVAPTAPAAPAPEPVSASSAAPASTSSPVKPLQLPSDSAKSNPPTVTVTPVSPPPVATTSATLSSSVKSPSSKPAATSSASAVDWMAVISETSPRTTEKPAETDGHSAREDKSARKDKKEKKEKKDKKDRSPRDADTGSARDDKSARKEKPLSARDEVPPLTPRSAATEALKSPRTKELERAAREEKKKKDEEEKRKREEEEKKRKEEEKRKREEEKEAERKRKEDEKAAKLKAEEDERRRKEEEKAAKLKAEEEERQRKEEEKRKREEDRLKAEEDEKRKIEEEKERKEKEKRDKKEREKEEHLKREREEKERKEKEREEHLRREREEKERKEKEKEDRERQIREEKERKEKEKEDRERQIREEKERKEKEKEERERREREEKERKEREKSPRVVDAKKSPRPPADKPKSGKKIKKGDFINSQFDFGE